MKNEISKILCILLCNILTVVFLLLMSDIGVYLYFYFLYSKTKPQVFKPGKFAYVTKPYYGIDFKTYFNGEDNIFRGRKPDGLEFEGKEPIVIFGCSYAHGQFLNHNQTFSYKLAHILKRPVYNRSIPGRGIQHMYWQSIDDNFYNDVPPSDTVVYLFLQDHYRRLFVNFISELNTDMIGHFKKYGDNLIFEENSRLKNMLISLYTFKALNEKYVNIYVNNPKHEQEITDLVLLYFLKTRENLEKRWNKKVNFTIIFYNDVKISYKDTLINKLKVNNFKIAETAKLSDIDLNSYEYRSPENYHPTEKTWDILTPLIAKELVKK